MPITILHISKNKYREQDIQRLLLSCNQLMANVLDSPVERIRTIINEIPTNRICVGEQIASTSDIHAPFHESFLLEGRPISQQQAVLSGIAQLVSEILGENINHVRGICHMVSPERWAIGGIPASGVRKDEIAARNQSAISQ